MALSLVMRGIGWTGSSWDGNVESFITATDRKIQLYKNEGQRLVWIRRE
jgi:hypothetical protein